MRFQRPFRTGASLDVTSPRAKAPDFAKPTSRLAFWRHIPEHEGRHSFSDGAWANLFSRYAAIHASTSGLTLVPRRKCRTPKAGAEAPAYYQAVPRDFAKASSGRLGR